LAAAWNGTKLKMHLFQNNFTPTTSSVLANFTECTFAGYAAQDISSWGASVVVGHVATMTAAPNTFTRSTTGAAQDVYGYYITNQAGSLLYWAEKDPVGPRVVTNAGDSVTVTAALTDQSL